MKPLIVLTCLIAALALPARAEQGNVRMYKCVDSVGKVYYSDKMNPDCGQGSELNRQGVVMPKKKKEGASPGQPAKTDPDEPLSKTAKEQERRGGAPMGTYTNEKGIQAARDPSPAIPAAGDTAGEARREKGHQETTELK